jgi:hypothetical protein
MHRSIPHCCRTCQRCVSTREAARTWRRIGTQMRSSGTGVVAMVHQGLHEIEALTRLWRRDVLGSKWPIGEPIASSGFLPCFASRSVHADCPKGWHCGVHARARASPRICATSAQPCIPSQPGESKAISAMSHGSRTICRAEDIMDSGLQPGAEDIMDRGQTD